MTEKRKTILDIGMSLLNRLLASPEKPGAPAPAKMTLEALPLDSLLKEKISLDRREQELTGRVQEIERQKMTLFEKGVKSGSKVEEAVLARRITELAEESDSVNSMLQVISKQKRLVHGLMLAKERAELLSKSGLPNLAKTIDLAELVEQIDDISLEGDFQTRKLDDLLGKMYKTRGLEATPSEDPRVLEVMKMMERARAAGEDPEAIKQTYDELDRIQKKSDLEAAEEER